MSDNVIFDPQTTNELENEISDQFNELYETFEQQGLNINEIDPVDIAQLFFVNGFMRACLAMHEDENLRETVLVMAEEIRMQTEK